MSGLHDSALDPGVYLHEYTHGLSSRLTGGPSSADCLDSLESGGLSEGWSYIFPRLPRVREGDAASKMYPIGDFVTGFAKRELGEGVNVGGSQNGTSTDGFKVPAKVC
ncbi:Fungalysin metallopeptidase-domain-containing protein [Ilyonectria destructans]|nr:Fungalysin metallopeptidase-domain-containing protein [Ilyonectria destructans]